MKSLNTTLSFRPTNLADAAAVVALFNAYSQKYFGTNDLDLDDLMTDWTAPGFDLSEVSRVVEDTSGRIIGYTDVMDMTNPHLNKYVWAILHPDYWDADLYHKMLGWAKIVSEQRISLAPAGERVYMSTSTIDKDTRRKKAFETAGYHLVRHFYRMVIELREPLPPAPLPAKIRIETINLDLELRSALTAMDEAFKDHWGYVERPMDEMLEQWQHRLATDPKTDPMLWFLAKQDDVIIANCRCSPSTTDDPEMGWVNQLSVLKPWRRQGIGMALLLTAFNEFHRRSQKRAGLGVDAASPTNATRLYEKAGMRVTQHYDSYEYDLRPGSEQSADIHRPLSP